MIRSGPRARAAVGVALAAFVAGPGCDSAQRNAAPCSAQLASGELLTNVTAHSVTVSWIASSDAFFELRYAPAEDLQKIQTLRTAGRRGELVELVLERLEEGAAYEYRLGCAERPEDAMRERPVRRFRTLRPRGETVSFAFLSDSHAHRIWARAQVSQEPDDQLPLEYLEQTLENVRERDVDFMLLGGDEIMTHCVECADVRVDGERSGADTARTTRQAELRYLVWRRLFGRAGGDLPLFFALGNHDGEAGFGSPVGRCGHYANTAAISLAARKRLLPDPLRSYPGGNQGRYFSFVSGDALFAILDVMSGPSVYPRAPSDWTLGGAQLAWLESTLASSSERWKFLIAHHLVGGHPQAHCYAYGRGGVNATRNGRPDGTFRGEQARIHELMLRHGAQFFLYGHDHVFAFAEKQDASGRKEGVYYVAGGQSSRTASTWTGRQWFQQLYDSDADGEADFLQEPGFLHVTVDGGRSVRLRYVRSDPSSAERGGTVVFDRTIEPAIARGGESRASGESAPQGRSR